MAPVVKVPLPTGTLGVVFKGIPPVVKRISEDSKLIKRVKEGYTFVSLISKDGTIAQNLTTPQLVEKLKESSEEEGRVLVLEIALPEGNEVILPEGDFGAKIDDVNGKATITQLQPDCPLKGSFRFGLVVDKVHLEDGTVLVGHSAAEIEAALAEHGESRNRRLTLVNPNKQSVSSKSIILPKEKVITLPTGSLGISLKGSKASIASIKDESALKGIVHAGFQVSSLAIPNKVEYIGYEATKLVSILQATSGIAGRVMTLMSPENPEFPPTSFTKIFLPSFGNAEEIGLTFNGTQISKVEESSTLFGMAFEGKSVSIIHDGEKIEYKISNEEELLDAILDSSGSHGRYMLLKD
jgi:hypothetical protein